MPTSDAERCVKCGKPTGGDSFPNLLSTMCWPCYVISRKKDEPMPDQPTESPQPGMKNMFVDLKMEGCTFGFNIYGADDRLCIVIRPRSDTMVNETPNVTPQMAALADLIIAAGPMRELLRRFVASYKHLKFVSPLVREAKELLTKMETTERREEEDGDGG